ncbi:hypothetical protein [Pseudomonas putida]|uniref:hypothetical protein n=1 Tax=Pseudomonas putida TaxID=303 RepID=UPI0003646E33|nr:hypothetical protein [Pseudomonas putida]
MNRYCMVALLTGMFVGFHSVGQAASAPSRAGTIQLAETMDPSGLPSGKQCTISGVMGERKDFKMADTNCKNDTVTFFKFNNVPSTTEVEFNSEEDCGAKDDWVFIVKAIKQPTTTGWLSIPALDGHRRGDIVAPGLELVSHHYDHGNIKGKLSCVRIITPYNPEGSRK